MKPFKFTLEAVAVTRQRTEQQALEIYAQTLLARQSALQALEQTQHQLEAAWRHWRDLLGGGCSASAAARQRQASQTLESEREQCELRVTEAERAVSQALQQMLVARQQREAVEKCRGKQRAAYNRDVQRDTQKFLDELATQRATPASAWRTTADPLA